MDCVRNQYKPHAEISVPAQRKKVLEAADGTSAQREAVVSQYIPLHEQARRYSK